MKKSKEDAQKTRQAILESALDVFAEKGFSKATFDEIAHRAGFTKGAIYWYFNNKADLVAALIVEYIQHKQSESTKNLVLDNNLDDLLKIFYAWTELNQKDLRYAKFSRFILCQMEWSETVIEKVDKSLKEFKDFYLEKIKKILLKSQENGELKDNIDIDKTQYIVMSCYMGIMFSSLSKRFDYGAVDMVQTGLKLLIDGIRR